MKTKRLWIYIVGSVVTLFVAATGCGSPSGHSSDMGAVDSGTGASSQSANQMETGNTQNGAVTNLPASNSASATSDGPLTIGSTAPDFTLQNLNGHGTTSLKQLLASGKPVLINAWASWCPPCKMETPDLVKVANQYQGKVQFVGVNLTTLDKVSDAKNFVTHYKIPYPVLLDSKGHFRDQYSVIAEPMTFLISPQGKILDIHIGMMTSSEMEQLVQLGIHSA